MFWNVDNVSKRCTSIPENLIRLILISRVLSRTSYQGDHRGCKQEPEEASHTDIAVTYLLIYLNVAVYI